MTCQDSTEFPVAGQRSLLHGLQSLLYTACMQSELLTLHVFGAGATGAVVILSWWTLVRRQSRLYSAFAQLLAAWGGLQLLTGSLLALAHSSSVVTFCARVGWYVAVVAGTELLLFRAIHKTGHTFPSRFVLLPLSAGSLVALLAAVVLGT